MKIQEEEEKDYYFSKNPSYFDVEGISEIKALLEKSLVG